MTHKEELIQAIERSPTVLERIGGVPKHLLSIGDLSDRDHRRAVILDRLQQKYRDDS
jgi:hypothetical protein